MQREIHKFQHTLFALKTLLKYIFRSFAAKKNIDVKKLIKRNMRSKKGVLLIFALDF